MATIHVLTEDDMQAVAELAEVRESLRKLKADEDALKARIQDTLGDADIGEYEGVAVVRVVTSWAERFDVKRFRSVPGYSDLVSAYTTTTPVRQVRLT